MDNFFFYLSKFILIFLNYEIFIFLSLLVLLYLNYFKKFFIFNLLLYFISSIIILISIFPVGNYFLYKIENYYENDKLPNYVDGIIVLSGSIQTNLSDEFNQVSLNELSERILYFAKYAKKYKNSKLVYSGGSSDLFSSIVPSKFAKKYFDILGIEKNRIIYENKSRNTFESIKNIKNIIKPKENEKWLLITSASHMYRSINVGCKLEWKLIPKSVDYSVSKNLKIFSITENTKSFFSMLKVYFAIIYYKITNRSC